MPKYLVEYKHRVEITYQDWVVAETEEEAIEKTEADPQFSEELEEQGIDIVDFEIVETEDEEDEE